MEDSLSLFLKPRWDRLLLRRRRKERLSPDPDSALPLRHAHKQIQYCKIADEHKAIYRELGDCQGGTASKQPLRTDVKHVMPSPPVRGWSWLAARPQIPQVGGNRLQQLRLLGRRSLWGFELHAPRVQLQHCAAVALAQACRQGPVPAQCPQLHLHLPPNQSLPGSQDQAFKASLISRFVAHMIPSRPITPALSPESHRSLDPSSEHHAVLRKQYIAHMMTSRQLTPATKGHGPQYEPYSSCNPWCFWLLGG